MPTISRSGSNYQSRISAPEAPQRVSLLDLRENYKFPGSRTLREWKDTRQDQEAARNYANVLRSVQTSHSGFQRIARIGDGTGPGHPDDRAAIGLVLDSINSGIPEEKQTGLEYMRALLSQPMSPDKAQFVYDSIANNIINTVGWTIESKQDYHSGREILSGLDTFSLLILRHYNMYPNLDIPSLLQARGMPRSAVEGKWDFHDFRAYLQGRTSETSSHRLQSDPAPESSRKIRFYDEVDKSGRSQSRDMVHDFADYEGFQDFVFPSIIFAGHRLDHEIFARPMLIRV